MNDISEEVAKLEVGESIEELATLSSRLGCARERTRYRFAPSLIVRSELELFNVSDPRFCVRAYLKNEDGELGGMVNLRRLGLLKTREVFPHDRRDLLVKPFADCLLKPHPRVRSKFHVLKSNLWAANGESLPGGLPPGQDFEGTPFVQHMQLCGGMCGQAAAFMAMSLLPGHCKRILGISEISAYRLIGGDSSSSEEIEIAGFSLEDTRLCLEKLGLSAVEQIPWPSPGQIGDSKLRRDAELYFRRGVRAHLLSGFPVILPVDIVLLKEKGAYTGVRIRIDDSEKPGGPGSKHAVLAVGCELQAKPDREVFLINDPATSPFLEINAATLFGCGANLPYTVGETNETRLSHRDGSFIPVIPIRVSVPLLNGWGQKATPEAPASKGLILRLLARSVWLFDKKRCALPDPIRTMAMSEATGSAPNFLANLRLIPLNTLGNPEGLGTASLRYRSLANSSEAIVAEIAAKRGWSPDRWIWADRTEDVIWIYDAESPAGEEDQAGHPFEALIYRESSRGNWKIYYCVPPRRGAGMARADEILRVEISAEPAVPPQPGDLSRLEPALISSASVLGLENALSHWPARAGIEIYAFMHGDIDRIEKGLGAANPSRASLPSSQRIAALWDGHGSRAVKECARQIQQATAGRTIHSLASYIPEFSAATTISNWESGTKAVKFVCQVAGELKNRGFNQLSVLELVCGNRLQSNFHFPERNRQDSTPHGLKVPLRSSSNAFGTLFDRLHKLLPDIEAAGLTIALELEPGPFYALNEEEKSLLLAAELLGQPKFRSLSPWVGFNLDIAHWAIIGGIDLDWVENQPEIYHRIVHAHISDHHPRAHFADGAIGSVHRENWRETFRPWLELYARRHDLGMIDGGPFCSGVVAVEIEACASKEIQDASVSQLFALIGRS